MDKDYRVSLLALRVIVEHERSLKGTIVFDNTVWQAAYTALNKCGYLDRPIPPAIEEESQTAATDHLFRSLLQEAVNLAELGDITEETEAHGWGKWLQRSREALKPETKADLCAGSSGDL